MASSASDQPPPQAGQILNQTIELAIEEVLETVRINLHNACKTWGERSPQYQAVRQVESELLIERSKVWGLSAEELREILQGLDISKK